MTDGPGKGTARQSDAPLHARAEGAATPTMSGASRLNTLRRMAETRPDDPRAHFGLALEYEKLQDWDAVVGSLRRYLELAADEGNAYGRLGHALRQLGRDEEAREAYRQGIEAAYRHGHPTMAMEFEEALENF